MSRGNLAAAGASALGNWTAASGSTLRFFIPLALMAGPVRFVGHGG
ncbi:MAG: hypothetical protein ACLTBF_11875 [Christensenellales bacterium]